MTYFVSEIEWYNCVVCSKRFSKSEHLESHEHFLKKLKSYDFFLCKKYCSMYLLIMLILWEMLSYQFCGYIYKSIDCGECGTESPTSMLVANGNVVENSFWRMIFFFTCPHKRGRRIRTNDIRFIRCGPSQLSCLLKTIMIFNLLCRQLIFWSIILGYIYSVVWLCPNARQ